MRSHLFLLATRGLRPRRSAKLFGQDTRDWLKIALMAEHALALHSSLFSSRCFLFGDGHADLLRPLLVSKVRKLRRPNDAQLHLLWHGATIAEEPLRPLRAS